VDPRAGLDDMEKNKAIVSQNLPKKTILEKLI
jgi:hypothetical protein